MRLLPPIVFALLLAAPAAQADDVSDAIDRAAKAYAAGDAAAAKSSLDLASQLLAQKGSDRLAALLPQPPAGWKGEEAVASGSNIFLAGGLTAKRDYEKDGKTVSVQLLANSPILAQLAPLFRDAQLLGGMGRVFGERGRMAVRTEEGELQLVLGRVYVTVSGSASEADKRAFLATLDLEALEGFRI